MSDFSDKGITFYLNYCERLGVDKEFAMNNLKKHMSYNKELSEETKKQIMELKSSDKPVQMAKGKPPRKNAWVEVNGERIDIYGNSLKLAVREIKSLKDAKNLENQIGLRYLDLDGNELTDLDGIQNLVNLEKLILVENKIRKIEHLEKMTKLKYLDLSLNQVFVMEGLDTLINLETLILHKNNINKIEGIDNLENLNKLICFLNCTTA